jgi:hypothetical protein
MRASRRGAPPAAGAPPMPPLLALLPGAAASAMPLRSRVPGVLGMPSEEPSWPTRASWKLLDALEDCTRTLVTLCMQVMHVHGRLAVHAAYAWGRTGAEFLRLRHQCSAKAEMTRAKNVNVASTAARATTRPR